MKQQLIGDDNGPVQGSFGNVNTDKVEVFWSPKSEPVKSRVKKTNFHW